MMRVSELSLASERKKRNGVVVAGDILRKNRQNNEVRLIAIALLSNF